MGLQEGGTPDGFTYGARYEDPATFARRHAGLVAPGCRQLRVTGSRQRPDESRRMEMRTRRLGDWVEGATVRSAEVHFTCEASGGPAGGRIIASTIRMQQPGSGGALWMGGLRGYTAPAARSEAAYQIMEHVVRSNRPNPQWRARQRRRPGVYGRPRFVMPEWAP